MTNHKTKNDMTPNFECCECLNVFAEKTDVERCPVCNSHHVIEITAETLDEWTACQAVFERFNQ